MPRPPKEPFFPPDDPRLNRPLPKVESVPWPVLEGIVHGLLVHYWPVKSPRKAERDLGRATVERKLMELARAAARLAQDYPSKLGVRLSEDVAGHVTPLLKSLVKPTYLVLAQDKSLILKKLSPFAACKQPTDRKRWLNANLPRILKSLEHDRSTSPVNYPHRTDLPPANTIAQWADWRGQTDLCHAILGWRYGLAPKTIKNILDDRS
jgi:hypothetical protein